LCREHGQQLTELAASHPKTLSNFGMFGVVKETGVDDEGLRDFNEDYFSYPLYRDENLDFYRAFGDGKITDHLSWWSLINPYKIYKGMKEIGKRLKRKNLAGNYKGEGMKTGGIIVFGTDGKPKYAYPENTGKPLNTDDMMAALRAVSDSTGESKEEL
jgi:hypothetical protein